jgi:hypothetical protein
MDADSSSPGWLLFLAQLPSRPSSARVALWRRLRAAGATTMVNGAWVLPETDSHATFFEQLREVILGQGGTAFILNVPDSAPEVDEAIVQRFQGDRAREYDEFTERCTAFLDEISKETRAGKYTFAEMEEGEQDLEKLARWLAKIRERDFFPDEHRQQSATMLARCRSVLDGFSQAVYIAEGVQEAADGTTPDQAPPESSELSGPADGRPDHPVRPARRARNLPARSVDHGPNRNNYRLSPTWPGRRSREGRRPITEEFRLAQVLRYLRRKSLAINFQGFGAVRPLNRTKRESGEFSNAGPGAGLR